MMTKIQAMYIKKLFEFEESDLHPTNKLLAEAIGVSAPTASEMIKKLRGLGYLEDDGLELSEKGKMVARELVSKHRIWETFLIDHLGYGWEEVHEDAEMLESVAGDKLYERLNDRLGRPKLCPHGKPIYINSPVRGKDISLMDASVGARYIVSIVKDDAGLLQYLNDRDIALGTKFSLVSRDPYDYSMTIDIGGKTVRLSEKAGRYIRVLPDTPKNRT